MPSKGMFIRVLCGVIGGGLAVLSLLATPAFAARSHDSEISGFSGTDRVVFAANGNAWIADRGHSLGEKQSNTGQNGIYEYDSYPSQTLLDAPDTAGPWAYSILDLDLAVDQETDEVFASQANGRAVDIFKEGGFTHAWTGIDGIAACCVGNVHIAIDNSETNARGRVYLSLTAPENEILVYDAGQHPVDFPATASYINGNRLTGTPSGRFGEVEMVSVDAAGNLYVVDGGKNVVDEFDSTGTFLRTFPDPHIHTGFGSYPGAGGVGIDPTNGNVVVADAEGEQAWTEYDEFGNLLGTFGTGIYASGSPGVNSEGYVYAPSNNSVQIFKPAPAMPAVSSRSLSAPTTTSATLNAHVDPGAGGPVTECKFEYGTNTSYSLTPVPCSPGTAFSSATDVSASISGLTPETTYHYRVTVETANGVKYGEDRTFTTGHVLGLDTEPATDVTDSGATLNASFVGNGEATHYYFEWGPTSSYGETTASPPGNSAGSPGGPDRTQLTSTLNGLAPYSTYHYRVVASNGAGTSFGPDRMVTTLPAPPSATHPAATAVHADRAVLHGDVNPNGGNTSAHFEYVTDAQFQQSGWEDASDSPESAIPVGLGKEYEGVSSFVSGLTPDTLYHFRVIGTNVSGSGSAEGTFTTFPFAREVNDPCPNSHQRQQTGASLLLDCRAYELVSASNTGGFDVESSLVAGQEPFAGYPEGRSPSGAPEVLYGVHDGGIPGTGNPTNRGVDPYIATRGENGWTTKYVGIPANDPYSQLPFASSLDEASPSLQTLAFGGNICSPCFADGSTGIPVHLPDGELTQGLKGSISQPSAEPAGFIGRHLSADGTHLVFGTTAQLEPDGNSNGDVSIYDRDLETGATHVVSKTTSGQTMTGTGIGELDISSDGSRIVIGKLVSEAEGAKHWHLYMDIGDAANSVDLTPGTTSGVLYDGMSADGSKVFFTTADSLLDEDEDSSADIYEAEVDGGGTVHLHLVSVGSDGSGNGDSCDPAANTKHEHWNTTGSEENCGVVAIGGGGGVAKDDGTIYFLSPELLDGSEEPADGVLNAPNLYVAPPGQSPRFVATLESSADAPLPPLAHPYLRSFGEFARPTGVAIDDSNGDTYVLDVGSEGQAGTVQKFDSSGHAIPSFGSNGSLTPSGLYPFGSLPAEIAVDNTCAYQGLSGSACTGADPSNGDLYVPDLLDSMVVQYNSSGARVGTIEVTLPTGVAVSPTTGDVYVTTFLGTVEVFDSSGTPIPSLSFEATESSSPTGVAVDTNGDVYVVNGGGLSEASGTTEVYGPSGEHLKRLDGHSSYGVAVDPSNNHVYVDEGTQVTEFDESGAESGAATGAGLLSKSISLAVDAGKLVVSNVSQTDVAAFGPAQLPHDSLTDNPLVIDSVTSPETRRSGDFEVTPSSDYAAFVSALPLTHYESAGHSEVFRYDSAAGSLACVSCNTTGEQPTSDSTLAVNGLSLSDDGRVFFNSTEGLVDRDLNEQEDVYEWEPQGTEAVPGTEACQPAAGCVQLISTGTSPYGSTLLGASADGTDAYFFTRDTLVSTDQNGLRVKLYDARVNGGYPQVPAPIPCQASDECHGPGSPAPAPPSIKTLAGTPVGNQQQTAAKRCPKPKVRRHGRCVLKHSHHRTRSRHRGRQSHGNRPGGHHG